MDELCAKALEAVRDMKDIMHRKDSDRDFADWCIKHWRVIEAAYAAKPCSLLKEKK